MKSFLKLRWVNDCPTSVQGIDLYCITVSTCSSPPFLAPFVQMSLRRRRHESRDVDQACEENSGVYRALLQQFHQYVYTHLVRGKSTTDEAFDAMYEESRDDISLSLVANYLVHTVRGV